MTPEGKPPELQTWKQIAEFLGVSIRTAQDWHAHSGLPVYKLEGTVKADPAELTAWLERHKHRKEPPPVTAPAPPQATPPPPTAEPAPPEPVPPPVAPKLPTSKNELLAKLAIATLLLICLGSVAVWKFWPVKDPPANLRVEGADLVVMTHTGEDLWRYTFPYPLAQAHYSRPERIELNSKFLDLDKDGKVEVLFAYHPVNDSDVGAPLYCFSETGQVKWKFTLDETVRNDNQAFTNIYFVNWFSVTKNNEVIVGSNHVSGYPYHITAFSSQGKELDGGYWHPGHLLKRLLLDLDKDGTEELIAGGVNNGYRQATVVVLDPGRLHGSARVAEGNALRIMRDSAPPEKAVVLFPRSCITEKFEPFNRVAMMRGSAELMEIQVSQTHVLEGPYLIYQLNSQLEVTAVSVSGAFENRHKELEAEGKLNHQLTQGELEQLKKITVIRR